MLIELNDITRVYHTGDVDVRALAGPTNGQYLLNGIDVARLTEPELARIRSEQLGFVFQSFNLLPRTSAIENAALPLFYSPGASSRRQSRFARAGAALERLGLAGREHNTPGQLSGGQQQRVAIARALINSPSLLLADEPTGNLDTRTSHEIMKTVTALNRQQDVTVIVVTHETDIAAYADRVITMRDGLIVSDEHVRPAHVPATASATKSTDDGAGAPWAFGLVIASAAVQAIARNAMRSALTMLGVFIGVAALIVMVAGETAGRTIATTASGRWR